MKIFLFIIGTLVLAFMAENAWSHDHHTPRGTISNVNSQALGLAASGHQFYWGQKKLQGSVSAATHGDSNGFSFALGKRVGKMIVTGSVTHADGEVGIVGSAGWTF